MIDQVEIVFNSFIDQLFAQKPDIRRMLKNHPRKQLVLKNICHQIKLAEQSNIRKIFDVSKYNTVICESAKLFAKAALLFAEQANVSVLERNRRLDEYNRIDNLKAEFEADQKEFESKKLVSRPGDIAR